MPTTGFEFSRRACAGLRIAKAPPGVTRVSGGPALEPTRGPAAGLDQPKASRWARPSVFTGLELSSRAEVLREWFDYTA